MLATIPAPVLELFPRVHALVRAGSTDYAESTMAIPVANYRDPAVFQDELEYVFGASPIAVVPSATIPAEGDYVTRQLARWS